MAQRIKELRVKNNDTFSESYPIGADGSNIDLAEGKNLEEKIKEIDDILGYSDENLYDNKNNIGATVTSIVNIDSSGIIEIDGTASNFYSDNFNSFILDSGTYNFSVIIEKGNFRTSTLSKFISFSIGFGSSLYLGGFSVNSSDEINHSKQFSLTESTKLNISMYFPEGAIFDDVSLHFEIKKIQDNINNRLTNLEKAEKADLPIASSSVLGGVKIGSNITNNSGTISITGNNINYALGYTPLSIEDISRTIVKPYYITSGSLSSIITPGIYYISGANITGGPSKVDLNSSQLTVTEGGTSLSKQILVTKEYVYIRQSKGTNTWTEWEKMIKETDIQSMHENLFWQQEYSLVGELNFEHNSGANITVGTRIQKRGSSNITTHSSNYFTVSTNITYYAKFLQNTIAGASMGLWYSTSLPISNTIRPSNDLMSSVPKGFAKDLYDKRPAALSFQTGKYYYAYNTSATTVHKGGYLYLFSPKFSLWQ